MKKFRMNFRFTTLLVVVSQLLLLNFCRRTCLTACRGKVERFQYDFIFCHRWQPSRLSFVALNIRIVATYKCNLVVHVVERVGVCAMCVCHSSTFSNAIVLG